MIYGYARVSTIAQCKNGNSLEEQSEALTSYGCNEIITETYTGKTTERPQFNEFLKRLHSGDTLVVTKLDRFARTVIEGVLTVRTLFERGVKVHILNIGLIENTLTGNLILTVFLAFAEFERGMIIERTQAGKAVARTQPGYHEGRPKKYTPAQINHALELLNSGSSYRQVEAMTGICSIALIVTARSSGVANTNSSVSVSASSEYSASRMRRIPSS